jgi:tRNA-2-methylthio-N6-dimethylallyladenosine synthase
MGRGYEIAAYRDLVARLRVSRPDIALSTDVIVGFPGETEADFEATLALVSEVRFASIYAFKYSPRPGTAAPRLKLEEVDLETADRRLQRLFQLQRQVQSEINQTLVGKTFEILVTAWGKRPGTQTGRTACHRLVHFPIGTEPCELGTMTRARIEEALPHSLLGRQVA